MQEFRNLKEYLDGRLKEVILRHTRNGCFETPEIPGFLVCNKQESREMCVLCHPCIGLTVQGFKHIIFGSEEYSYGENHVIVAGVDLPSESYITTSSADEPFLSISIELDRNLVAQLTAEMPAVIRPDTATSRSVAVIEADERILDAFLRLALLLDNPADMQVLAPMIIREIHYRILQGANGQWLRAICSIGTSSNQVAQAVSWLQSHFKEPFLVDDLAHRVGMSPSSFFRNFKHMTGYSPLQFQKALRLYEARRLMLVQSSGVAGAAYAVGYESPTQFIREYKRLFGVPPHKDIRTRKASGSQS